MKDIFIAIGIVVVLFATLFTLLTAGMYPLNRRSCEAKAAAMGVEYHFDFWTDCMVKVEGQFFPLDQYAAVKMARDRT